MDGIRQQVDNISAEATDTVKIPDSQVDVLPAEKPDGKRSFSTNGGVGVEARDVAAKVTLGTGDIQKDSSSLNGATISGSTVNMTVNNDNSKVKASRFDKLPSLPTDTNQPQLGDSSMSR